ncbi:TPA: hypothetical protein PXO92_000846 [Yersinia enterocolitica]|nr:hypothetical protein [Yersinia enterocolitica]
MDLKLIRSPLGETKYHAIFVHGLDGDLIETWQSPISKEFWPNWLFDDIPGLAIWTIGYPAAKSLWHRGQAMHVTDRGRSIYELLVIEEQLKTGDLIFIGHSMGGLIIKQILRVASDRSSENQIAHDFITRVKKVVFLATPHSGSSLSSWGQKAGVVFKPSPATYSLGKDDPNLRDLNLFYRRLVRENNTQNLTLVEMQTSLLIGPIKGQIVDPSSADAGVETDPIPVDADHYSICKPESREKAVYKYIVNFIKEEAPLENSRLRIENKLDQSIDINERIEHKISILANKSLSNTLLYDKEIKQIIFRIRKLRFFGNFSTHEEATQFLGRVSDGDLCQGSNEIRSQAISWCIRLLSYSKEDIDLNSYVKRARALHECVEVDIADAFIRSRQVEDADKLIVDLIKSNNKSKRSAGLLILSNKKKPIDAINWYKNSGENINYFDEDGIANILKYCIHLEDWELLDNILYEIKLEDYHESLIITHLLAISYFTKAIADTELKHRITEKMLFSNFPLSSDKEALENRRIAVKLFQAAVKISKRLGQDDIKAINEDYSLWLRLQDPDFRSEALLELNESMHGDGSLMLRRFPMAVGFLNVEDLNLLLIEEQINKETATSLGLSYSAALARYCYLFHILRTNHPKDIYNYLKKHEDQLKHCALAEDILGLECELLIKLDQIPLALEKIQILKNTATDTSLYIQYENIIKQKSGEDSVLLSLQQYSNTKSIYDLSHLVNLLRDKNEYEQLEFYEKELFNRTRSIDNLLHFTKCLQENGKFLDIHNLLSMHKNIVDQSFTLQVQWGWSLFRQGHLELCGDLIKKIKGHVDVTLLEIHRYIANGDWPSLAMLIEEIWHCKDEQDIQTLLQVANLSKVIIPSRAAELINYIADRDDNNPNTLASLYGLATSLGIEEQAGIWLNKAISLSDSNGPMKQISLKEIVDMAPEWQKKEKNLSEIFDNIKAPIFLIAKYLNRTISSFYIIPFLVNKPVLDIRTFQSIPAYASHRPKMLLENESITLDLTSLMTLGCLKQLDKVFDYFKIIFIPHSLMATLFHEKEKISFHQPSRFVNAKNINQYILNKKIRTYDETIIDNINLALEVGEELASLIEQADKTSGENFVVSTLPIHKVGSYMTQTADLGEHKNIIISCTTVVINLKRHGFISSQESELALEYLNKKDSSTNINDADITINNESNLYISDLALNYFQITNILDPLVNSSFNIFIHNSSVNDDISLLTYRDIITSADHIIEYIRSALKNAIEGKKVKLTSTNYNHTKEIDPDFHMLEEIMKSEESKYIVSDDRFLNQYHIFPTEKIHSPTYTSLDILNTLHANSLLSENEFRIQEIKLRAAHYHFIPISHDEIDYWLDKTSISPDGVLLETQELATIRRYLIKLKMSRSLQLPRDAEWLITMIREISACLKNQWIKPIVNEEKVARSNWLLRLLDYRGWSQFHHESLQSGLALNGQVMLVSSLLFWEKDRVSNDYWFWLDNYVLEKMEQDDPYSYQQVIKVYKDETIKAIDKETNHSEVNDEQ